MSLNVYYDHVNRLDQKLLEKTNTFNIDFQHHLSVDSRNDVVWGLGYRVTDDKMTSGYNDVFVPLRRTDSLYSAFVQDEIRLANSARLTIGSKLEHNDYTGFEYEPGAQFVWTPTGRQTIWLSASRAIRQPSRQNTDLEYDVAVIPLQGGLSGVETLIGNADTQSEKLLDYEAGYRSQVTKRLSLDVTLFRSYYRQLQTLAPGAAFPADTSGVPYLVIPLYEGNGARATTYGGEVFATWNVTSRWRLSPGYSLVHMTILSNPPDLTADIAGDTPKHGIQFRSTLGLRSNLDWDTSIYFVGQLSAGQIPGYTRLDTQLRWRIAESAEVSITGQNLLTARHAEFIDALTVDYTQVQRSILGKITWRF
jgi:iron complex outermembrane receptor protein